MSISWLDMQITIGKAITVINGPNKGRTGCVTDFNQDELEFVVFWDTDESISIDKYGKTFYNMFDPVSKISVDEIFGKDYVLV